MKMLTMNEDWKSMRQTWRQKADKSLPDLQHQPVFPVSFVHIEGPSSAPLKQQAVVVDSAESLPQKNWKRGQRFILDFGEHHVGYLSFSLRIDTGYCDSPVSLRIVCAELPYEALYTADQYHGSLSQAWMQEDYYKFDDVPGTFKLPRRYAFRYLTIDVLATPCQLIFDKIELDSVSAENRLLPPPTALTPLEQKIFTACNRTLRDCMQESVEDGPKRDRRLWLGDLFLQAKVNAVTYRNPLPIEHSIYLLAANIDDRGLMPACAFEHPGRLNGCFIPDYTFLFAPLLLDHYLTYGHEDFIREFYPLARHQFVLGKLWLRENGTLTPVIDEWYFIDHAVGLKKDAAEFGSFLYGIRQFRELAKLLGCNEDVAWANERIEHFTSIARSHFLTADGYLQVDGQLSIQSQIWGVLGGILTIAEGRKALRDIMAAPDTYKSRSPYLLHYYLEALQTCGLTDELYSFISSYWGAMIELGADTFWEVFDQKNCSINQYNDHWLTSACHAWSGTPAIFLAKKNSLCC